MGLMRSEIRPLKSSTAYNSIWTDAMSRSPMGTWKFWTTRFQRWRAKSVAEEKRVAGRADLPDWVWTSLRPMLRQAPRQRRPHCRRDREERADVGEFLLAQLGEDIDHLVVEVLPSFLRGADEGD